MNVIVTPSTERPLDLLDRGFPWLVGEDTRLDVQRESPPTGPMSLDTMLAIAARRGRRNKPSAPTPATT